MKEQQIELDSSELIEWQYIYMTGRCGYWVIKDDKHDYEKHGFTATHTKMLKKGEDPNVTYFPITTQL